MRRLDRNAPAGSGFTLIELLVVVVIVAVLAGAVALAVGLATGPSPAERESRRLMRVLELACERAVLTGRDYGLLLATGGYAFAVRGRDGWVRFADGADAVLAPRTLDETLSLVAEREGRELALPDDLPEAPQFGCIASGELTPFVVRFEAADGTGWHVEGSFDGRLEAGESGA